MAASYPGAVKTYTDKVDGEDKYYAAHVNEAYAEIIAVETELFTKRIYIDSSANSMLIYIPCTKANTFMRYELYHSVRAYTGGTYENDDQWRIRNGQECTYAAGAFTESKEYTYINTGEWECAIQLATDNFVGGFHGYEKIDNGFMLVDGIYKALGATYSGWCKSLTLVQNSHIIRDGEEADTIANHSKHYEIDINGITIRQRVVWVGIETVYSNFMGMLPIRRTDDGTDLGIQITDSFFSDFDYVNYDVALISHGHNEHRAGVETARIWGDTSGVSAVMTVKTDEAKSGYFYCEETANYNKLYFAHTSDTYTTEANEVWENESYYKIDVV